MSISVSETSVRLLRKLISTVTGLEEDCYSFEKLEKRVILEVEKSDSMSFKSREEMDAMVDSLSDKFLLHGLKPQGEQLSTLYKKFMDEVSVYYDASNKRSVVRFIIAMAESPTNNFFKYVQHFKRKDEQLQIDWPEYLKQGIQRWTPPLEDTKDDWSSDDSIISLDDENEETSDDQKYHFKPIEDKKVEDKDVFKSYYESKNKLLESVQYGWFNSEFFKQKPTSEEREANIALLWEDYITEITGGLIPEIQANIISEYKVMREIIWQLYEPTNSFCFQFSGNRLVVRDRITLSSVREYGFKTVVCKFLPYILMFQALKEFQQSVTSFNSDPNDGYPPPDTYRGYLHALCDIFEPIFESLRNIEEEIRVQEKISTLITLFEQLSPLFKTVETVKRIHDKVVLDFRKDTSLHCAVTLLARMNFGFLHVSTKLEQDVMLTMYLESIRKYLDFIDSWLSRDTFEDYTGEFVIEKGEIDNHEKVDYSVREINSFCSSDPIINLIRTEVLQMGKNVHLLGLLDKRRLVSKSKDKTQRGSLHQDYVDSVLKEMAAYFSSLDGYEEECPSEDEIEDSERSNWKFKFPLTNGSTQFDHLENLVDTSDGFLVVAFKDYFIEKNEAPKKKKETVYLRVCKTSKGLCPIRNILQDVLFRMLKERFSISGMLVKNLLISDYKLEKYFKFLKHLYLFNEELTFPWYRRFLEQINVNPDVIHAMQLTSHLQDVLMDIYPEFFETCRAELKLNWNRCNDTLKMCTYLRLRTSLSWPISLIVLPEHLEMYQDLFQFILNIKWALYTLNHLYFTELEPKSKYGEEPSRLVRKMIAKLKIFRFRLVNDFSSIQHYVLGYVFNKFEDKFRQDLNDSYNFETVMHAHESFITGLHKQCTLFKNYRSTQHGFYLQLYLVRKLSMMWKNVNAANDLELDKYVNLQKLCHETIDPIVNQLKQECFNG